MCVPFSGGERLERGLGRLARLVFEHSRVPAAFERLQPDLDSYQTRAADSSRRALAAFVAPESRVLEIGCGNGRILELLASEKACRVAGIDVHPVAVELAQKKGLEVVCGDADDDSDAAVQELLSRDYEVAIFSKSLSYLQEPEALLRRLRVKEHLIFQGNHGFLASRLRFLRGRFPHPGKPRDGSLLTYPAAGNHRYWTLLDLLEWGRGLGLEAEELGACRLDRPMGRPLPLDNLLARNILVRFRRPG